MTTSKVERRLWKCPYCQREYRIPASADDPMACPECAPPAEQAPAVEMEIPTASKQAIERRPRQRANGAEHTPADRKLIVGFLVVMFSIAAWKLIDNWQDSRAFENALAEGDRLADELRESHARMREESLTERLQEIRADEKPQERQAIPEQPPAAALQIDNLRLNILPGDIPQLIGEVRNLSNQSYRDVLLTANAYSSSGELIDRSLAIVSDLSAGSVKSFSAEFIVAKRDQIADCRVYVDNAR